jgi:hypothetical protein
VRQAKQYTLAVPRRPLSKFPLPIRRYFQEHPNTKRSVTATVSAFTGYGTHFHVVLREEDEPVFNRRTDQWEVPSRDPAGEGKERMMKFRSRRTAMRWIEATFEAEFSYDTHQLSVRDEHDGIWHYGEGD